MWVPLQVGSRIPSEIRFAICRLKSKALGRVTAGVSHGSIPLIIHQVIDHVLASNTLQ